jgi:DNA polymerase-3 subunit epsilon/exodeoxyribonuclease X
MLIFLDMETTGYERGEKTCSLGVLCFEEERFVTKEYSLVNEGKKIPPEASAIHNITNEMIADAPSLPKSAPFELLFSFNNESNSLVMHGSEFFLELLRDAGLIWHGKIIDTQRVAKHLSQESEIFSLEFLRYELRLYRNEDSLKSLVGIKDALISHHALSDAVIIKLLFDYFAQEVSCEQMSHLSFEKVLLEKFTFGKYKGRYIEEIAMQESTYLQWMLSLESLDSDLRYSLEYYLKG